MSNAAGQCPESAALILDRSWRFGAEFMPVGFGFVNATDNCWESRISYFEELWSQFLLMVISGTAGVFQAGNPSLHPTGGRRLTLIAAAIVETTSGSPGWVGQLFASGSISLKPIRSNALIGSKRRCAGGSLRSDAT